VGNKEKKIRGKIYVDIPIRGSIIGEGKRKTAEREEKERNFCRGV